VAMELAAVSEQQLTPEQAVELVRRWKGLFK
jgi:hypothetical protein